GRMQAGLAEAKNTAFPLFGGSRSFVNGTTENLRIGWQLDFVGKFVPAVAFFYQQGDALHLFFPQAISLLRLDSMVTRLQSMVAVEANLVRKCELRLGGYFEGRSEVALAFLHRVFEKLSEQAQMSPPPETPAEEEESASLAENAEEEATQGEESQAPEIA